MIFSADAQLPREPMHIRYSSINDKHAVIMKDTGIYGGFTRDICFIKPQRPKNLQRLTLTPALMRVQKIDEAEFLKPKYMIKRIEHIGIKQVKDMEASNDLFANCLDAQTIKWKRWRRV